MIHRFYSSMMRPFNVVNCFQFSNFSDDSQVAEACKRVGMVVNCFQFSNFSDDSQDRRYNVVAGKVVNCFQFSNFSDDSQGPGWKERPARCCELLSVL